MRYLIVFMGLFALQACKHPLAIQGEGDIVERIAGTRGCSLEEFRSSDARCTDNAAIGEAYTVSYEAIPREGWVFAGWQGTKCSKTTAEGYCEFNMPEGFVSFVAENIPFFNAPATIAVFVQPGQLFEEEIAGPILEARCMACHVEGGLSGFTRLVFDNSGGPQQNANNILVFRDFLNTVEEGEQTILTKVRGGAGHGGGTIFSSASDEYDSLVRFLNLLQGENDVSKVETTGFWQGIKSASASSTLRRASLILAGRLPTEAELNQARSGPDGLRSAIRGLMKGDGFHDFLIRGANDRLLTDAMWTTINFNAINVGSHAYPATLERGKTAKNLQFPTEDDPFWSWNLNNVFGFARAPLELIAYIVENDRPYTEVVTADYTMANRASAETMRADQLTFDDPTPPYLASEQFKRTKNRGHIVNNGSWQFDYDVPWIEILSYGDYLDYPHAGVLSELAFLGRYPTTETNRNRARARWTYYHFLGVDIEKSAGRTQDPKALADTNNPTLNNPNCAVCHELMDPVAGAFQNFYNDGLYRPNSATDALPEIYKTEANSPYQPGDTWYRDMRPPGYAGQRVPAGQSSIQWLGQKIAADPRFATATVVFWWPALMGSEVLEAPEVSTDEGFAERLAAFEVQQEVIQRLGRAFRNGIRGGAPYNAKDLLTEMVMSPWFRAERATKALDNGRQLQLADAGVRRLLTPEEVQAKTQDILGFVWRTNGNPFWDLPRDLTGWRGEFALYYGDIDSSGITERARQLTPVMLNVAQRHAFEVSCYLTILDFNRPDRNRQLFSGIERHMTPEDHEALIRDKLIDWHEKLWNEQVVNGDPRLETSYQLLVDLRETRQREHPNSGLFGTDEETCLVPNEFWDQPQATIDSLLEDPADMLPIWRQMVIYFLSDFAYLHE